VAHGPDYTKERLHYFVVYHYFPNMRLYETLQSERYGHTKRTQKPGSLREAEKMLRGVYHAKAETALVVSSLLIES
jgi:hypothetical protein